MFPANCILYIMSDLRAARTRMRYTVAYIASAVILFESRSLWKAVSVEKFAPSACIGSPSLAPNIDQTTWSATPPTARESCTVRGGQQLILQNGSLAAKRIL